MFVFQLYSACLDMEDEVERIPFKTDDATEMKAVETRKLLADDSLIMDELRDLSYPFIKEIKQFDDEWMMLIYY